MKLLMPAVETVDLPRGFASSNDPTPCYWVWSDRTFTIRCICGLSKEIRPDSTGRCHYEHKALSCGWSVNLVLEEFDDIYKTKKEEREERRRKEAAEDG